MAATSANVRSRPGEALTASPVKGGAAQFGLRKKRYTDSGTRWQVVAFRAVRDGDLKVMRELAFEQPGLLHDRFTDAMEDWELEFESPKWYQFRDATCLFIACAYARREAVEFLLEFGADRDDKCYMSQKPIDVVGMCREDDMDESYITTILSRPKQPPRAPREPKTTSSPTVSRSNSTILSSTPGQKTRLPTLTPSRRSAHETPKWCLPSMAWMPQSGPSSVSYTHLTLPTKG